VLLAVVTCAVRIEGARSSERNLKTLKQQAEEQAEAEQKAQNAAEEAARLQRDNSKNSGVERVVFLGPKTGWGFVKTESPYYSVEGKNLGALQAGTLFKYTDVKQTEKDDVLLAVLRDKSGWHGDYLLPCTGVAAYEGDPEKVDIQIVSDLRNFFLLKGELETYRNSVLENEYRKNPYFEDYRRAAEAYNASVNQARQMEEESAGLSGIQKTQAYEKLREIKYKQEKLLADMRQIGERYREWKELNPIKPELLEDDRTRTLRQRMEQIKVRVADLIPPDDN